MSTAHSMSLHGHGRYMTMPSLNSCKATLRMASEATMSYAHAGFGMLQPTNAIIHVTTAGQSQHIVMSTAN